MATQALEPGGMPTRPWNKCGFAAFMPRKPVDITQGCDTVGKGWGLVFIPNPCTHGECGVRGCAPDFARRPHAAFRSIAAISSRKLSISAAILRT